MFRYLGIVWDPNLAAQARRAEEVQQRLRSSTPKWVKSLQAPGLSVFTTAIEPARIEVHKLIEDRGVVLGTLFERNQDTEDSTTPRKVAIDIHESRRIANTRGRRLIARFWGNYVSFLRDADSRVTRVIKDPTGSLPCYFVRDQGILVFWSNVHDYLQLQLRPLTINWSYICAQLASGGNNAELNALNEVSEVLRGECIEVDYVRGELLIRRSFYWNPLTFSEASTVLEDPERAARALKATVQATVRAWADCHESIIVRLSGGLDSSIVLSCLSGSEYASRVACWAGHRVDGLSDERPWARLAANRAPGVLYRECALDPRTLPVGQMMNAARTPAPLALLPYLQVRRVEIPLATERRATAVFNGDGGDNMFGSDSIRIAVDDYVKRHGPDMAALRLAARVAVRRDTTVWKVLFDFVKRGLSRSHLREHRELLRMTSKLVSPDVSKMIMDLDHYPHPYFRGKGGSHWRTVRAMGAMLFPPEFYDPFEDLDHSGLEVVAPILSQPVVELCLNIPVYVHFEGGRDRGLARRAFSGEVPTQILRRQWKDRAPSVYEELLNANLSFVREQILDGLLLRQGLLNREALERALSSTHDKTDYYLSEIWNHLDIEIWLKSWAGSIQSARRVA